VRREFLTFAVLGATNTLLGLLLYWLLLRWMSHTFAYAISYAAGIVFSAAANARFTFRTALTARSFALYTGWLLGLYAFNALFLEVLVRYAGIDAKYAVLVVIAVAVPLGFIGSRWTLSKTGSPGSPPPRG
jgi:putative flippase GtrA